MRGLVAASDLVYALSMIAFWLFATAVTIELEKAG
jgi:hypothetical protein